MNTRSVLHRDILIHFRKVMLDIAVPQPTGFPTAGAIEDCLCPRGYSGRSCEECSVGHFRDKSDRSQGPLGTCRPCECGGNEIICEWDPSVRRGHRCQCRAGFAGERLVDKIFSKLQRSGKWLVHGLDCSWYCLPVQPGCSWFMLDQIYKPFFTPLHTMNFESYPDHSNGNIIVG